MIDLSAGYTSSFRLMAVNPDTWADEYEIGLVSAATVDRSCTDEYPLLESGTFTLDTAIGSVFPAGWYRLEMLVRDDYGQHERLHICTQRLQSGSGTINRGKDEKSVHGQSVLQPLSQRALSVGAHVPKGVNAVDWVLDLFDATPAPVQVDGDGFVVDDHYVFDPGTSYLRAVWDVLNLGQWCMQIDGSGMITLRTRPETPAITLDKQTRHLLLPGINYEFDLSNVPNHYVAIADDGSVTEVYNELEDSDTSVIATGGLINDYVDTAPTPIDGEGMYGYVRRMLEEQSLVTRKFSYTRKYIPGVGPFDLIDAMLQSDGIVGDLRVLSQSLRCGRGISVSETVGEEIKEYWT